MHSSSHSSTAGPHAAAPVLRLPAVVLHALHPHVAAAAAAAERVGLARCSRRRRIRLVAQQRLRGGAGGVEGAQGPAPHAAPAVAVLGSAAQRQHLKESGQASTVSVAGWAAALACLAAAAAAPIAGALSRHECQPQRPHSAEVGPLRGRRCTLSISAAAGARRLRHMHKLLLRGGRAAAALERQCCTLVRLGFAAHLGTQRLRPLQHSSESRAAVVRPLAWGRVQAAAATSLEQQRKLTCWARRSRAASTSARR